MEEKNPLPLSFDVAFMFYLRQVWCSLTERKKLALMLTKLTPGEMSYFNKNVDSSFKQAMIKEDHTFFKTVEMTFAQWCTVFKTFKKDKKLSEEFVSEFINQLTNETLDNNDDDFVCGGVVLKYLFIKDYELPDKPEGPNWKPFVQMENELKNVLSNVLWANVYSCIAFILWSYFHYSEQNTSFLIFIQKMNLDSIKDKIPSCIQNSLYGDIAFSNNMKCVKAVWSCLQQVFSDTMKKIHCKIGLECHVIDLF